MKAVLIRLKKTIESDPSLKVVYAHTKRISVNHHFRSSKRIDPEQDPLLKELFKEFKD